MRATVFHNQLLFEDRDYPFELRKQLEDESQGITVRGGLLKPVALIELTGIDITIDAALNISYSATNSHVNNWFEDDDPRLTVISKSRSTSVGDVIQIDRQFWMVAPIGFRKCRVVPSEPPFLCQFEARNAAEDFIRTEFLPSFLKEWDKLVKSDMIHPDTVLEGLGFTKIVAALTADGYSPYPGSEYEKLLKELRGH